VSGGPGGSLGNTREPTSIQRVVPFLVPCNHSYHPSTRSGQLQFDDAEDLVGTLEDRLRDLAARQRSAWVKLGPIVFPGRVYQQTGDAGGTA